MSTRLAEAIDDYFLARQPRKDSEHTLLAYRSDLSAVTAAIADHAGIPPADLTVDQLTLQVMRAGFAAYAKPRAKTTVRRCWSTWHGFFNHLVTEGLVEGNPMGGVARPAAPRRAPKPLDAEATDRLLQALFDGVTVGRDPWPERDLAVVFTALVTGARLQELLDLNIGSLSGDPQGRRLRIRGKGDADRTVPIEPGLEEVLNTYLESRRTRFPKQPTRRALPRHAKPLDRFPSTAPLFVDRAGERLRRGGLQYLVQAAYRRAGVESTREKGALVHALRHTFATRLAENPTVGVVQLMELLGHRSLSTTQGYVKATGKQLRAAAAANPVYAAEAARGRVGEAGLPHHQHGR
ncbi:MAG: tyrosine-type recombinase/integrase [Nocardioides sp.]|nr:tyrosine-type recombinase/integrase [Nocardioides sp.]